MSTCSTSTDNPGAGLVTPAPGAARVSSSASGAAGRRRSAALALAEAA